MNTVGVMSYSGCHVVYNGYDVVNYSGCDPRNTVGAISSIQWSDDTDTVDTMSNTVSVMTQTRWFEVIK